MYICEQCGKEVYEVYGSGRFCNRSCANKYVALHQSPEAKARKIALGRKNLELGRNTNVGFTEESRIKGHKARAISMKQRRREWLKSVLETGDNSWEGSYCRFRDALIEFGYKEWKCDNCNNTEWMGNKIPIEVHHIKGYSNKLENIQFLCPNCHALTDNYRWRAHNSKKIK